MLGANNMNNVYVICHVKSKTLKQQFSSLVVSPKLRSQINCVCDSSK